MLDSAGVSTILLGTTNDERGYRLLKTVQTLIGRRDSAILARQSAFMHGVNWWVILLHDGKDEHRVVARLGFTTVQN